MAKHARIVLSLGGSLRSACVVFLTLMLSLQVAVPLCAAEELWLAVGYGGRRMISADGLKWEVTAEWAQPGGDDSNNLMSAVYGQEKFVVVGGGGGGKTGGGHILVSQDGREWREVHKDKARVNPIVFGKDRFVVGTSSYPSGKLMWSDDGEKWHAGAAIEAKGYTHFRGGAYGNGLFVLVGNGGGQGGISWAIATPDGEKIVSERNDLPGHGTIVFGAGKFYMLTSHTKADLIASADGAKWEQVKFDDDAKFEWLVWTGREIIAGDHKTMRRTADGEKWERQETPSRGDIKWSDGKRFISSSWPGKMAFSPDGKTWEQSPPLTANGINRVVYRGGK